ncbi:MAG: type II toxin-antitoxin system death-on-curing family toxin [Actinomycetes bacterium]
MTEYLELEDALSFIRRLGIGPLIDIGLLDAGLHRPRSTVFGGDAYPSLGIKAAALLHSLAKSHPLVDGNKRLAWLSTVVFLDLNGHRTELSHDAAFDLVWSVAAGNLPLDEIARLLRVVPADR